MNLGRIVLAVAMLFAFSVPASAATLSWTDKDLGTLGVGDSDSFAASHSGSMVGSSIVGSLEANSMLTVTYTYKGGNVLLGLSGVGVSNGDETAGQLYVWSPAGSVNMGSSSAVLLSASTVVDAASKTITTIITNTSSIVASFRSVVAAIIAGAKGMTVSYSVSSVPLPAALPLFALGLAGLAGVGVRRKNRVAA